MNVLYGQPRLMVAPVEHARGRGGMFVV